MKSPLPLGPARRGPRSLIKAAKGMIAVSFLGACRSGLPNEIDSSPKGDAGDGGDSDGGDATILHVPVGVQIADAFATDTRKSTARASRGA
jgi:hypothetical protein